jgi:hypothetical protein
MLKALVLFVLCELKISGMFKNIKIKTKRAQRRLSPSILASSGEIVKTFLSTSQPYRID